MSSPPRPATGGRLPLALVPFVFYFGMTVVLPAMNGAAGVPEFREHALIALTVSGSLTGLWVGARRIKLWVSGRGRGRLGR